MYLVGSFVAVFKYSGKAGRVSSAEVTKLYVTKCASEVSELSCRHMEVYSNLYFIKNK
jgi:hypothetical protein